MTARIRTYQVLADATRAQRLSLQQFIAYCTTTNSGPAPTAMPGAGVAYAWKRVTYNQHAVLPMASGSIAYCTAGEELDPTSMQCALVLQSQSQCLLFYTALSELTAARCAQMVEALGGPSPFLLGTVVSPVAQASELSFALQNIAQATAGPDQPAANSNIVGVWNFVGAPCGISPLGLFGTCKPAP